jgi:hypothetical protein
MNRKFGYYIVFGMVSSASVGMGLGTANGSVMAGIIIENDKGKL